MCLLIDGVTHQAEFDLRDTVRFSGKNGGQKTGRSTSQVPPTVGENSSVPPLSLSEALEQHAVLAALGEVELEAKREALAEFELDAATRVGGLEPDHVPLHRAALG